MDSVSTAAADMRMIGMTATDQWGKEGPVTKPTRWMSCEGEHVSHAALL